MYKRREGKRKEKERRVAEVLQVATDALYCCKNADDETSRSEHDEHAFVSFPLHHELRNSVNGDGEEATFPIIHVKQNYRIEKYDIDDSAVEEDSKKKMPIRSIARKPYTIDWDSLPESMQPASGELNEGRSLRKQQQLVSILSMACSILPPPQHDTKQDKSFKTFEVKSPSSRLRLVDFGAGSGHLGLTIAYLYPHIDVVLVERKEYSTRVAQERVDELQLSNCFVHCGDILEYQEPFDVAVSLHSCGILTDHIFDLCAKFHACCCLVPCCYGQLTHLIKPQSNHFKSYWEKSMDAYLQKGEKIKEAEESEETVSSTQKNSSSAPIRSKHLPPPEPLSFHDVVCTADFTVKAGDWQGFVSGNRFSYAKSCMMLMDIDRCYSMLEKEADTLRTQTSRHRQIEIHTLQPVSCSPKNNLVLSYWLEDQLLLLF